MSIKIIYQISIAFFILIFGNSYALPNSCDDQCIINIVWENIYNSGGEISNLCYSYVPDGLWSADSCTSGSFAIDEGRPCFSGGPVYLFGWAKAYHDGRTWRLFGGIPAKYFLDKETPFHGDADAVLTITTPFAGGGDQQLRDSLNSRFPSGCSEIPDLKKAFGLPGKCSL